jgi:hypothetical protein
MSFVTTWRYARGLRSCEMHVAMTEGTLADAICDRIVHNAHVLALRGPSIRQRNGMNQNKEKTTEDNTENN